MSEMPDATTSEMSVGHEIVRTMTTHGWKGGWIRAEH